MPIDGLLPSGLNQWAPATAPEGSDILLAFQNESTFPTPYRLMSLDSVANFLTTGQSFISVKEFGATGNGVTNDTAAIQAALIAGAGNTIFFPKGRYLISAPLFVSSNTRVSGVGTGSVLMAASVWPGTSGPTAPYMFLVNENYAAISITDHDIIIDNLKFDYTDFQPSGGAAGSNETHAIRMQFVRNVTVQNCTFQYGGDATAFLGCDNTLVLGCASYEAFNCPWDHWQGPSNGKVIGCYVETAGTPVPLGFQLTNWNARLDSSSTDLVADGFVMTGCEFVYTGTGLTNIVLRPLGNGAGNVAQNCSVVGNTFRGNIAVSGRGDCRNIVVSNNVFSDNTAPEAVISFHDDGADRPSNIVVSGNIIKDPATTSAGVGVILIWNVDGYSITGNIVTGTAHDITCYVVGSTKGTIVGNHFDPGVTATINGNPWETNSGGMNLSNNTKLNFYDTNGHLAFLRLQNDNNFTFFSPNDTGVVSPAFSYLMSQSTPQLWTFYVNLTVGLNFANRLQLRGMASGTSPQINAVGTDTNVALDLNGQGTYGVRAQVFTLSGVPTGTDIPANKAAVVHNTGDDSWKLYVNTGSGIFKSVTLT